MPKSRKLSVRTPGGRAVESVGGLSAVRAFIFDLDGVVVDSERVWHSAGDAFHTALYGAEIFRKLGSSIIGLNLDAEYELATGLGFAMDKGAFLERYDEQAARIYEMAEITDGLDLLVARLRALRFKIGLVSASRPAWVAAALRKASILAPLDCVISLADRPDLRHKPEPDGYLEAMRQLGSRPETTVVLEDSNAGIRAAKAAGALTIGFRANLVPSYAQSGADLYADTVADVINIVEEFAKRAR